ncbi:MAG: carbohydrate kinase family protein [Candidatus Bathyarchaeales archaeon]
MHADAIKEVMEFLKKDACKPNVVVMPDFFLDRLIHIESSLKNFLAEAEAVVKRKGGSIDNISQMDFRGGNAANTASALARLGARVTPIICTSKLGTQMLKLHFKRLNIDLSHIKICKKPSITTALEFNTENGKANVMLRDLGSLADFSPELLDERDFDALREADYVCVFNWAGTRRFGTELAEKTFRYVKKSGRGKTYYDTADPTPNNENISQLVKRVLQSKDLDILSVNENEAICYAKQVAGKFIESMQKGLAIEELAKESAKILASKISARLDLHTTHFSATFTNKKLVVVPAFKVRVLRATGAGDAWNAGNILGHASNLSDEARLMLANAVATYYISSADGRHPTRKQLLKFCERFSKNLKLWLYCITI